MFDIKNTTILAPEELAICQRVFDHVCAVREVTLDMHREEIARQIIQAYRDGVKSEEALKRLLS